MLDILRRFRADLPVSDAEWEAWQAWRGIGSSASGMKRKRKKRRKRRTPRTSSRPFRGRARRRHRQWYAPGWFSSVLAVFLSYGRPQAARHHCRYAPEGLFSSRSSFRHGRCALGCFSRCVPSFPAVAWTIMRSSFPAVACARLVLLVTLHLTLCFFPCRQAQDRGITAGMDHLVVLCLLCATTGALGLEVQKTAFFWRCCSSPTRSSTSPQRFPTCSWTW